MGPSSNLRRPWAPEAPQSQPGLAHLGHLDDIWDVQVGLHRREATADEVSFVSFLPVHLTSILLRVHSHSADAQLCASPEYTDGDLAWGQQDEKLDSWVLRKAERE